MRQQVMDAYGDTLPAEDWKRAMEGLRMLDQLRATGSITEAVLRHLEAVLQALREFLTAATPTIKAEIDAIKAVLIEYGYEQGGTVNPAKAKKQAAKPKSKSLKQEMLDEAKALDASLAERGMKMQGLREVPIGTPDVSNKAPEVATSAEAGKETPLVVNETPVSEQQAALPSTSSTLSADEQAAIKDCSWPPTRSG